MNTNRSTPPFTTQPSAGKLSASALIFVAVFALACGEALAQEQDTSKQKHGDDLSAPPPMRYLPDEVRRQLEAERDPKARTRLSLELAEERLARVAEQANADR